VTETPTEPEPAAEKLTESVADESFQEEQDVAFDAEFERQEFPTDAVVKVAKISPAKEEPRPTVKAGSEVEAEMQRLLDELSNR
jgi:hypothetical protein